MDEPKITYGVWIPTVGWLKAQNNPLAFELKEIAESTAQRIGNHARVEFIDNALFELENQLLEAEREQAKEQQAKPVSKFRRLKHFLAGDGSV